MNLEDGQNVETMTSVMMPQTFDIISNRDSEKLSSKFGKHKMSQQTFNRTSPVRRDSGGKEEACFAHRASMALPVSQDSRIDDKFLDAHRPSSGALLNDSVPQVISESNVNDGVAGQSSIEAFTFPSTQAAGWNKDSREESIRTPHLNEPATGTANTLSLIHI